MAANVVRGDGVSNAGGSVRWHWLACDCRFTFVPATLPPYSINTPAFRFRGLAALAGRSPLGGDREVVLATLMAARCASSCLPPDSLSAEVRQARADRTAKWLGSMAIPAEVRSAAGCVIAASAAGADATLAEAIEALIDAATPALDRGARAELEQVVQGVRRRS
jgi:hypothetical protein